MISFFSVSVPFISSSVQSKLAIRAVLLNDAELLKSLIDDVDRVYSVGTNEFHSLIVDYSIVL